MPFCCLATQSATPGGGPCAPFPGPRVHPPAGDQFLVLWGCTGYTGSGPPGPPPSQEAKGPWAQAAMYQGSGTVDPQRGKGALGQGPALGSCDPTPSVPHSSPLLTVWLPQGATPRGPTAPYGGAPGVSHPQGLKVGSLGQAHCLVSGGSRPQGATGSYPRPGGSIQGQ